MPQIQFDLRSMFTITAILAAYFSLSQNMIWTAVLVIVAFWLWLALDTAG